MRKSFALVLLLLFFAWPVLGGVFFKPGGRVKFAPSGAVCFKAATAVANGDVTATMTAYNLPSPNVVTESSYNTYRGWKAFDHLTTSTNYWYSNAYINEWVKFDFGSGNAHKIVKARLMSNPNASGRNCVKEFKIQGSSDGSSFTDVYSGTATKYTTATWETFTFSNSTAYRYYRFLAVQTYGEAENASNTYSPMIIEIEFWETN